MDSMDYATTYYIVYILGYCCNLWSLILWEHQQINEIAVVTMVGMCFLMIHSCKLHKDYSNYIYTSGWSFN